MLLLGVRASRLHVRYPVPAGRRALAPILRIEIKPSVAQAISASSAKVLRIQAFALASEAPQGLHVLSPQPAISVAGQVEF